MNHLAFRLRVFLAVFLTVMVMGTAGFMIVEDLSLSDAFYFSIVTVTTVGYGDISPVSTAGKVLAIFLILSGVGTFLGVVANATEMMLNRREQNARLQKLNMVTGVFFSGVGTELLRYFIHYDPEISAVRSDLIMDQDFSAQDFLTVSRLISSHNFDIDIGKANLDELKEFLEKKGDIFLRLLENPTILEHEDLSQLLWAVLHLKEELYHRQDLRILPQTDKSHLAGDIKRSYSLLAREWVTYMKHLKDNFPYLFSLALRINPFSEDRNAVVNS